MLPGDLCVRCKNPVEPERAQFPQTKYCLKCAGETKREDNRGSEIRTYADRNQPTPTWIGAAAYQRQYRLKHPGLSSKHVRAHRARKRAEREERLATRRSSLQANRESREVSPEV